MTTEALICFFGGAFLANGVPHFVQGVSGRGFPTPFARPSGRGESSAVLNVIWGAANFCVAWLLLVRLAQVDLHTLPQMAAAGAGALLMGLGSAWHFGTVYGGNRRRDAAPSR